MNHLQSNNDPALSAKDVLSQTFENKLSLDALMETEKEYRRLFETMLQGVVYQNSEGFIVSANPAAERILGLTLEEMQNRTSEDPRWISVHEDGSVFLGEDHPSMVALRTGKPVRDVIMGIYNPILNSTRWIVIDAVPLFQPGEVVPYKVYATFNDITERKIAEESLRISEERFQSLVGDAANLPVQGYDQHRRVIFWNKASERVYGYTQEEALGHTLEDLIIPPPMREAVIQGVDDWIKYNRPIPSGELSLLHKDGSLVPVYSSHVMIKNAHNEHEMYCLDLDLTDLKKTEREKERLEAQLLSAQKLEAIGRLAGGVAHDFNNMLSVILGYSELIKYKLEEKDPIFADIVEIEKAAVRSRDITRQLLAFSRKQVIAPKPIDLNLLIRNTENTLARLMGEDIDLQFHPEEKLWRIKYDPTQIELLLVNLAANARDAMPHGGRLIIETYNMTVGDDLCKTNLEMIPGPYVLLKVRDTGIGMDKETLLRIFEPFYTTKEIGKGTGLGLATVYGIVKQNRGMITVNSEPGNGTEFCIYLPSNLEECEIDKTSPAIPVAPRSGTILLVEDDDMVRPMTASLLKKFGYKVHVAETPKQAIALCEEAGFNFDLLLTDVVMPGMSGKELRDRIESKRPGTKVLFMSGYPESVITKHGVIDEGIHYIQKPFSIHNFSVKIQDAMQNH